MDGLAHFTSHLREWEPSSPFVELAIFGTSDPQLIAQMLMLFAKTCCAHATFLDYSINRASAVSQALNSPTSERSAEAGPWWNPLTASDHL